MSRAGIRQALEAALDAATALPIAWENHPFKPTERVPYLAAFILGAEPEDVEVGSSYRDRGVFAMNLVYPVGNGPKAAEAVAQVLADTFYRGSTFTAGGTTVRVERQPEIGTGRTEGETYVLPVRVRYYTGVIRR